MNNVTLPKSMLTFKQERQFTKTYKEGRHIYKMILNIHYDDRCKNGHNTFSITSDIYENGREYSFGCQHDKVMEHFPEHAHLIKWHLVSSHGPMHYLANTLYHISDKDIQGLRRGEYGRWFLKVTGQIHDDKRVTTLYTSDTIYANKTENLNLEKHNKKVKDQLDEFLELIKPEVKPLLFKEYDEGSISQGKLINLEAARICAVWPDAELEDITEENLINRLPKLMEEFKKDMESLGFTY